jgi:hypothetical protein
VIYKVDYATGSTYRMEWNIYGKLQEVVETTKNFDKRITTRHTYDAAGQRVHTTVKEEQLNYVSNQFELLQTRQTMHWRDAQGNTLQTESRSSLGSHQEEFIIYGSSRLGTYSPKFTYNPYSGQVEVQRIEVNTLTLGFKAYELSNHLGNVLTIIADNVLPNVSPFSVDATARILHSQDYLPFGMAMTNRGYTEIGGNGYAFGFNTQRKDLDIDENGNHYTAEFWEYDSRIGRRWNIDTVVKPWESGYACLANSPILYNDPLGNDPPKAFYDTRSRTLVLFKPTQEQVKALVIGVSLSYHGHSAPLERGIDKTYNNIRPFLY